MAVEDLVIVPVSFLYLFETEDSRESSTFGFLVEKVAVGLSTGIGILLLLLRSGYAFYHMSLGKIERKDDPESSGTVNSIHTNSLPPAVSLNTFDRMTT